MSKNKKVTFKSTAILLGILIILVAIKILMPSKDKIGEIEVRKVEVKAEELVKIPAYAVDKDSDSPRKYAISTKEAATSDLLQVAVQDMTKNYSEDLEEVISEILKMQGVEIEICGNWIWLSGNTKEHKEKIKSLGCFWASQKKKWYYRPSEHKSFKRSKAWNMETIREKYIYRYRHYHHYHR